MKNSLNTSAGKSEKELALWMLDQMRDSEEFLGVLKAARVTGTRDILDSPAYIARHQARLKPLFQSDSEDDAPISTSTASNIEALVERDLLSSREELIEKALTAYLEKHPEIAKELPVAMQPTFEAARAEIEGQTSGVFEAGFVGKLAAAARTELARQAEALRELEAGRGGREE